MVLAAGMLSNALMELQEAALLSELGPRPWDTESIISSTSDLGKFLHTILGYDSAPTLAQITLYWGYLAAVLCAYLAWPSPTPKPRSSGQGQPSLFRSPRENRCSGSSVRSSRS
jgi:high-affinity Fe2+/Pb2+ permease